MMPPSHLPSHNTLLLRLARHCTSAGLLGVAFYLWQGFGVWSFGVGILFGFPVLVVGIALYLLAVIRDLRQRGIL